LGFSTGIAASAGLVINGWDSHRNNDYQQAGLYRQLFGGLAYLHDQAAALDILDRLNVVVISEFSRTPAYNGNEGGKDHHSVGSWMTMLWGSGQESGIRVVGGSDENVLARRLTEQAMFAPAGEGEKLTPSIVHNELRHVAGLDGTDTLAGLELDVPRIRIWG